MPVVSTSTFGFGGRQFKRTVQCNRDGLFQCKLPPEIPDKLGCDPEISGKTMDEIEKQWRTRVEDYEKAQTKCSKVILYDIEITAKIEKPKAADDDSDIYELILDEDELGFAKGIAVAVHAGVFREEETIHLEEKRYKYVELDSSLPRSMMQHGKFGHEGVCEFDTVGSCYTRAKNVIPWTEQREMFFRDLGWALEQLIMKIHEFMGVPKKLMKLMDTNARFLPPPPSSGDDIEH